MAFLPHFAGWAFNTRQSCELHAFTSEDPHLEWQSGVFLIILSTIQFSESPGCAVVSRDHAVCLAAEHAERRRSPSTTEIGAAEGAESRTIQNTDFFDACSIA